MGEYATRKCDGEYIKIGTCESMYYLRFEDRDKVSGYRFRASDGLSFRLPFPDEDHILPGGNYESYERGEILQALDPKSEEAYETLLQVLGEHPGKLQLRDANSGLMLIVPCYHGQRLPEVLPPIEVCWNGKAKWPLQIVRVKWVRSGLRALISCRGCGRMWSSDDWELILPLITNLELRQRLERLIASTEASDDQG